MHNSGTGRGSLVPAEYTMRSCVASSISCLNWRRCWSLNLCWDTTVSIRLILKQATDLGDVTEMGLGLFKVLGSGDHALMEISSLEAFRGITFVQFCAGKGNIYDIFLPEYLIVSH